MANDPIILEYYKYYSIQLEVTWQLTILQLKDGHATCELLVVCSSAHVKLIGPCINSDSHHLLEEESYSQSMAGRNTKGYPVVLCEALQLDTGLYVCKIFSYYWLSYEK